MRVIANVDRPPTIKITLTPTLSQSTGRGSRSAASPNDSALPRERTASALLGTGPGSPVDSAADAVTTPARPIDRWRAALVLPLLLAGVGLARGSLGPAYAQLVTLGPWGPSYLVAFAGCVALLAVAPPTGRPLARLIARLRRPPSPRGRRSRAVAAATATLGYLLATALAQHRATWPYLHDEFSYLIQAHQFAAGHLWYRPHPLADFFDSFQLFPRPVYASAYFPGTALLYVPGVWLGVPPWVTSLAVAAAVAGLLYRVVAEAVDGLSAALAVLLLWCVNPFRSLSVMPMGQLPLLLYALLAVVAWLNWRTGRRPRHLLGVGLWLGLAAVTRPVDAACFAVPIAVDVAWSVGRSWRPLGRAAGLVAVGTLPCLLLQATLDRGITGQWTRTPFRLYADRDYPGTAYGFGQRPADVRPLSPLPQKQQLYREYLPLVRQHTPGNVWRALFTGFNDDAGFSPPRLGMTLTLFSPLPFTLLAMLVPLSVLSLTRPRVVLLAAGPLFLGLYAGYVFFFPYYPLAAAAAVILAVVLGADALGRLPLPRRVGYAGPVLATVLVFGVAVAGLPQWDATVNDDLVQNRIVAAARRIDRDLAPRGRAVVLYAYDPARSPHDEPVFNADVPWPDDAPIVRAHDLGPDRDRELVRYYADRQPDRTVYRYDERTGTLSRLGTAAELGRHE